jgi:hypothetical protein
MAGAEQQSTFACPNCGKKYKWNPALAGRKSKCTCGNIITTPATLEAFESLEEAASPKQDDDLYGLVEDEPVRAKKAAPTAAAPITDASGGASQSPPKLPEMPNAFGQRPVRQPQADAEAGRAAMLKLLLPIALVLILGLSILGYKLLVKQSKAATPALGEDAEVEKMIDEENGTEARQWLKDMQTRMVLGMTRGQADNRIQSFYDMGAVKVYAFGGVMSTTLAIELPKDPASRAKLFAFEKEWHEAMMIKPHPDVGQKYLLLRMRI